MYSQHIRWVVVPGLGANTRQIREQKLCAKLLSTGNAPILLIQTFDAVKRFAQYFHYLFEGH
jgi:hypothetical protein